MTDTPRFASEPRELPLPPGGEVEIVLTSNDVWIRGVDRDRVVVRPRDGHDLDDQIIMGSAPGRVWIHDTDRGFRLGPVRMRTRGSSGLDIEVPRMARISFRTLSGDLEASGLSSEARWASASGNLRLDVRGGTHVVDSMSGDVLVEATGSIGLRARTLSGDVRVRAPRVDTLAATTTSGDVRVEAELGDDARHEVNSVSGDVEVVTSSQVRVETQTIAGDVRVAGSHAAEGGRGRRTVVLGAGTVHLSVRTTSGDILIRGAARPDPVADSPTEGPIVIAEAEAAPNLLRPADAVATARQGGDRAEDRREAARLDILRALERGDLDIDTASRRLEILEAAGPRSFRGFC